MRKIEARDEYFQGGFHQTQYGTAELSDGRVHVAGDIEELAEVIVNLRRAQPGVPVDYPNRTETKIEECRVLDILVVRRPLTDVEIGKLAARVSKGLQEIAEEEELGDMMGVPER